MPSQAIDYSRTPAWELSPLNLHVCSCFSECIISCQGYAAKENLIPTGNVNNYYFRQNQSIYTTSDTQIPDNIIFHSRTGLGPEKSQSENGFVWTLRRFSWCI